MSETEYSKIIALLDAAKNLFARNAGNLDPADLRIRCLVNITSQEAQRALLESARVAGHPTATSPLAASIPPVPSPAVR